MQTNNFIDWNFGNWIKNQSYSSPDLTSIVQELVNQPGWQSGNAIAFLFEATGSQRRKAYAFEQSPADGPQLEITYMGGGQAAVQQVTQPLNTPFDVHQQVEFPVVGDLLIYPNPTQYELYLEFESFEEMPVTINLYDVSGRLIRSNQFDVQKGFNKIDFSTGNASEGMHFIHLKNDKISKLEKVMFIKR